MATEELWRLSAADMQRRFRDGSLTPVTVAQGGTVAAGSVVNKNTEPGTLTVARARQASIGNWQRPKKK